MTDATCLITNCRSRAPADNPFCSDHRDAEPAEITRLRDELERVTAERDAYRSDLEYWRPGGGEVRVMTRFREVSGNVD